MTTRSILKQWFSRGKKPTAAQFAEWIDSFWHKGEDNIGISDVHHLQQTLNGKSDIGHTHDASEIQNLPSVHVDVILDSNSTNPVENRVIAQALVEMNQRVNGKSDISHNHDNQYQPLGEYAPANHSHTEYATHADVNNLQEQIEMLAQGGGNEKEVIAVSTHTDLEEIADPSQEVIYKTLDTNKLYLYNGETFEDVTGVAIDNTIYVTDIAELLTSNQEHGLYSVLVVSTNGNVTSVNATYSFAITSITRLLQNKDGWAERISNNGSYVWQWHTYSYNGHGHQQSDIAGLIEALAGKAATNHTHSQYLTQHQDISGKQDKTDNSLQTTVKTIVGAINELLGKFSDYSLTSHTHSQYLTAHQDISGKQDVISDLATIRANAQMAATRAYTLDFGTGAELIQDVNMLGAITINRIDVLNVAHLYVTYGNVSHQEIDLTQPVSLSVADGVIITWEIVRSIEDGLACVGVRCNINPSNNA